MERSPRHVHAKLELPVLTCAAANIEVPGTFVVPVVNAKLKSRFKP
jgi:hypothetical protein